MAIWQFSVNFIPKQKLIARFGKIPKTIEDEIFYKEDLAESVKLPSDYENFLNCLGEKEILKWTNQSFNWGDYDMGTHITISLNKENLASVFCRFHVGDLDEDFVKTVLKFASLCDCVLLTNNETIIEPDFDLFMEELKKSRSFRFCVNPVEYLQSEEVKQINWSVRKKIEDTKLEDLIE